MSPGSALSAPDAIMEPGVLAALKAFISSGGGAISQPEQVKEAIRQLAESYQGRAQICNILGKWAIEILGDSEQEINEIVMNHFKELAIQQFDISKADSIFSIPAKGEPEWLSFMIRDSAWRSVLYTLSQQHPNCLLLNFAIRKITEEGHGNELPVTSRPGGDLTFDLFRSVFRDSLLLTLSKSDPVQFQSAVQELQRSCCQTQHTYLFAQLILAALSQHPARGAIFHHLAQAIGSYAEELHGARVRSLDLLLTHAPKYPEMFSALNAVVKGARLTSIDVKNLYTLYSGNDPPPIDLLRRSPIYISLIESLLDYTKPPLEPVAKQYTISLLAYASCVRDHRLWYAAHSTNVSIEGMLVDKSKMNTTIAALNDISSICQNKDFGFHIVQDEGRLRSHLVMPVCAAAVLHWIQLSLLSPAYYSTTYQTVCTPVLIRLLGIIATLHRLQRTPVFELLVRTFNLKTDLNDLAVIKFRKMVLHVLIHLVHHGLLFEVTGMVKDNVPRMDHSLVRFFVTELLQSIGPPYSAAFAQQVFEIIAMPDAALAIRNDPDSVDQVSRFVADVQALNLIELRDQCQRWRSEFAQ